MRKIISLICFLLPALAFAASPDTRPELRGDAPDRHVVVKGDTLWDISGKFFKDPWKWPYIWGMNKDTIKDPHWIYPGDVIVLDRASGTLRLGQGGTGSSGGVIKLSPKVRESYSDHDAVPSIPASAIAPFLSQPLAVGEGELNDAPTLIGAREGRVILGANDVAFVKGLPADKGSNWQIYRPGKTFTDPVTNEVLGVEAIYLGAAEATNFADVSTVTITRSTQEISKGDRLVAPSGAAVNAYLPRAPGSDISAHVISVYGGVSQAGQNTVITLSKGARDGLESGHVLALYHKGNNAKHEGEEFVLPDERIGLAFVFRVFDKVSYALVMQSHLPVQLLDRAQTP
ncbi:MAG: peptidoglycan-binding protein [Gallionellales bacterium RIFCSPLOWO2_12_FULL_59_22]|nr:MAG: peptidoglycan-binding protein [Gallionellales bacterium RIFCSPLOWO2_02_FULL_59_110]OGT01315.1 MAG: peptidoglycan-binding protein [Gallionellales bacterium RIFCSPLOWO2_02_58_13]OGT12161.1 MAG: peptidoglycan-binding protein [Gallionellales bacterium RIFCSPLOWO2_12_FULL_59_22]